MPKKVCPNGHIYDSSIYGDECPLCPKGGNNMGFNPQSNLDMSTMARGPQESPAFQAEQGTHISTPNAQAFGNGGNGAMFGGQDASGETKVRPQQPNVQQPQAPIGGGTVIRQPKGAAAGKGRKLVGFLVTYNGDPLGKAFNLYEGKNFIGRDQSCDISLPWDHQISGRHMSILYRNVDNKFKYRDEQSSNGTFVNKELSDEGELQNYDIIRLGNTVFIFIAIPKLG